MARRYINPYEDLGDPDETPEFAGVFLAGIVVAFVALLLINSEHKRLREQESSGVQQDSQPEMQGGDVMLEFLKRVFVGGPNPYWIVYDFVGGKYSMIQSFWRPSRHYYEHRSGPHPSLDEAKQFLKMYQDLKA